jgi:hypothetical protein
MQKSLLLIALLFSIPFFGQTAYIEVKGEPDLTVYLNSSFKGKTTAELNGMIIENVNPGKNLIKIVKEGYTPFEETITVKPGEVLAYKVKPFTKHVVHVSEEGNTEETSKQATLKTGKLVIQSVPIEIKITIPGIDGIDKSAKTKDKWLAEQIPTGMYEITFTYNQKEITKTVKIFGDETTSVFVNMLSGDLKVSNSMDERNAKQKEDYLKYHAVANFIDSLCTQHAFKLGLSKSEFRRNNSEAGRFMDFYENYAIEHNFTAGNMYSSSPAQKFKTNVSTIRFNDQGLSQFNWDFVSGEGKGIGLKATENFNKMVAFIESTIPKEFIKVENSGSITYYVISYPKCNVAVQFSHYQSDKNAGHFGIQFNRNYSFKKE